MRSHFIWSIPLLCLLAMAAQSQPAEPVLDALGYPGLQKQVPQALDLAMRAHGLDRSLDVAAQARLKTDVLADWAALDLNEHWRQLVAVQPPALQSAVAQRLNTEIAKRVRQAQAAPRDPSEWQALQTYRQQLQQRPPRRDRAELMARLVDSGRAAEMVAILHSGIERLLLARAQKEQLPVVVPSRSEWPWITAQRHQRLRQLEIEYSYYAYRFFSNVMLEDYLSQIEHGPVSQLQLLLLDRTRTLLLGDLAPPPQ